MRADLVALGGRLGWVGTDDKEEPAFAAVMERLRHEGEGILLIFDNAIDADVLKPYLRRGSRARNLECSCLARRRGAGRNPLVAQGDRRRLSGRSHWPREAACDRRGLVGGAGGLPLAHEQAAAYCERLDISFAEYRKRFETAPALILD